MAGVRYVANLLDVGALEYVEELVGPASLIFHSLTALPVARWLARALSFLLLGVVSRFRRRDRIGALEPAIEVDVFAAPGAERPKALDRGLAADGAGLWSVRGLRHAVQIRRSAELSKRQIPLMQT
jgi:hypothetical protein